ncbi:MAG: hypothetical protein ACREEE_12525 [Dongiaceae bacterium]
MNRSFRNDIASATAPLCIVSFGAFLWLFFAYFSTHPVQPDPERGYVHALSNHGSHVYLTDIESTGLALLMAAFAIGFLLTIAIAPKDHILPPPKTPRWIAYVSARYRTDLADPSPRMKAIFLCSLGCYVAVILLAGRSIASFVVSLGIVLEW